MIINMQKFTAQGRPLWEELEQELQLLGRSTVPKLSLEQVKRLHYLYSRSCADLSELRTYGVERDVCDYLEALCARAYAELHTMPEHRAARFHPVEWLLRTFPRTVRRHSQKLLLSLALTLMGVLMGASLLALDPLSKEVLLPYAHLAITPAERVAKEERATENVYDGRKLSGSIWYMTHNSRVGFVVIASGMTCGVLTFILLFANGVLLGAVCLDYIVGGQALFLTGWLLPHGSVEIPAILLAGQAGLILGAALIGGRTRLSLAMRLRQALPDIVTLMFGVMLMMAWAGVIEAAFSQYHEPVLPYWFKIAFGTVQLLLVLWFFG
ncbi:MAG: stage II sporulation protein M, partial [Kiritimatiellae bacterium]|nr:stage II sporulation protein M [Kiritimatiellia bacterium]